MYRSSGAAVVVYQECDLNGHKFDPVRLQIHSKGLRIGKNHSKRNPLRRAATREVKFAQQPLSVQTTRTLMILKTTCTFNITFAHF